MKLHGMVLFLVLSMVTAGRASAMFRSSDLVVVPVAAATVGLQNSNWRTDVEIMNVDTDPVDVLIVYLPTGNTDNRLWYNEFKNALGGRSEDGFTNVNAKLKDIAPGRAVILEDIIKEPWGEGGKGALLVFAFKAGSFTQTTPPGGTPRKILVNSRTYSLSKNIEDKPLTFGQSIPGLPWYYYADPGQKAKGLDHVVFSGIREDASYRCAFGLVNLSDPLTSLNVKVTLIGADGTEIATANEFLQPLAHVQYDKFLSSFLGKEDTVTVENATLTIAVTGLYGSAESPTPALMAYVSRIDNLTNDPVYLEQRFEPELPWDCVFNGNNCPSQTAADATGQVSRLPRRPLLPPVPNL